MLTLSTALDHLARGRAASAADVLSHSIRASERSLRDQGSWDRARFLKVMPLLDSILIGESEDRLIVQEVHMRHRLGLAADSQSKRHWWPQGKGKDSPFKGKGKGKDGKGKGTASVKDDKKMISMEE